MRLPVLIVAGVLAVAISRPAYAIPAFGREYNVPCQTCHVLIGRRNEFGDAFRKWGYHWPVDAERDRSARKDPPTDLKGISAFDGFIPSRVPLALVTTFAAAYTTDPNASFSTTVGNPTIDI